VAVAMSAGVDSSVTTALLGDIIVGGLYGGFLDISDGIIRKIDTKIHISPGLNIDQFFNIRTVQWYLWK